MSEPERVSDPVPRATPAVRARGQRSETRETLAFLLKLALAVLILRSFIFAPFSIPSESMLPRLLIGDYLFISKWNYGYTRHSLPFSLPLIPGRVLPHDPTRGDVVVFKAPPTDHDDYIKRVIGLPGDTVQMRRGQLVLNGQAIPKQRIADFVLPLSANFDAARCGASFVATDPAGQRICRYPRYRETLPGGRSYAVLDQTTIPMDDTDVYRVPVGHVFLMGDNRDDSADSRFPAVPGGGIGFVPLRNLEGKAVIGFWSSDGSARWWNPLSWLTAARYDRIGEGF